MSARILPDWQTPCCERIPVHVTGPKFACTACGLIWFDTAAQIRDSFGDDVRRVYAQRDLTEPVVYDGWIARHLDV